MGATSALEQARRGEERSTAELAQVAEDEEMETELEE